MMSDMILADIGNTHCHILDGGVVRHLKYDDAIDVYGDKEVYFISVSSSMEVVDSWIDISSFVSIDGEYDTMGIDRKALCLSRDDGVFVDAGSAITVDVVSDCIYRGGFILSGLRASLDSYRDISTALDIELNRDISLDKLPMTTKDGISYGIIASIKSLIDIHHKGQNLYFTGGDGEFLSRFFPEAIYDELLVFEGMIKVIKERDYVGNSTSKG